MNAYARKVFAAAWVVLGAGVIVIVVFAVRPAGAHAAAVTRTATPAQAACSAFAAWERDQAAASLGRLAAASAKLPRSWLKADVFELAATVSSPSPKAGKYIPADRKYVTEDCANL